MTELNIEISEDLKQRMLELHGIDWSSVIASFIREKLSEWSRLNLILEKSELTEEDAIELGREVNKSLAKRYKDAISLK